MCCYLTYEFWGQAWCINSRLKLLLSAGIHSQVESAGGQTAGPYNERFDISLLHNSASYQKLIDRRECDVLGQDVPEMEGFQRLSL